MSSGPQHLKPQVYWLFSDWLCVDQSLNQWEVVDFQENVTQPITKFKDYDFYHDDQQFVDAFKDVTAHIIDMKIDDDENNISVTDLFYSMVKMENIDKRADFTVTILDAIPIHALSTGLPLRRRYRSFQDVIVDPGHARGSTGHVQYMGSS